MNDNGISGSQLISAFASLLGAGHSLSEEAPSKLLKCLMQLFPLKACSFYSYNSAARALSLRSQCGFNYRHYASFMLPMETPAGRAITNGEMVLEPDLTQCNDFRDITLITETGLSCGIYLPIRVEKSLEQYFQHITMNTQFAAVIGVYPTTVEHIEGISDNLRLIEQVIADAYALSITRDQMEMREELIKYCSSSRDLNTFIGKFVQRLEMRHTIDAASVYMWDDRAQLLRMVATTGLNEEIDHKRAVIRNKDINALSTTLNTSKPQSIVLNNDKLVTLSYAEKTKHKLKSMLTMPILSPPNPYDKHRKAIGVLRITNRILSRNKIEEAVPFGWEDHALWAFVAEFIGIVSHMFSKGTRAVDEVERAFHGVKNNLLGMQGRLIQLQERGSVSEFIDKRFEYHLPDAIAHLEALQWQLARYSRGSNTEMQIDKVQLMGDVISKLPSIARKLSSVLSSPNVQLPMYSPDMGTSPTVSANAEGLLTVFRNLLENAIKYNIRGANHCDLKVFWSQTDKEVWVYVGDNGLGIDIEDRNDIFLEGWQADNAMRRNTSGVGIGLSQCKEIMRQMGGDISLLPRGYEERFKTVFVVQIPKWKE